MPEKIYLTGLPKEGGLIRVDTTRPTITYREYRALKVRALDLPDGTRVKHFPVNELLTPKVSLDPHITRRAVADFQESGYIPNVQAYCDTSLDARVVPVVMWGTHAICVASANRVRNVDVVLQQAPELKPTPDQVSPVRELAKLNQDRLRIRSGVEDCVVTNIRFGVDPSERDICLLQINGDPRKSCRVRLVKANGDSVTFVWRGKDRTVRLAEDLVKQFVLPESTEKTR